MTTSPRTFILAGGSGFLGTALARTLAARGDMPVILTRDPAKWRGPGRAVAWDGRTVGPWARELEGAAAIINLTGRTVDCRKTPANKRVILESRVDSVRALAAAYAQVKHPPKVWVQFATGHIHGDTGDEILGDDAPVGTGFAPEVGMAWERAFAEAALPGCRRVVLRISFVLGATGGALPVLARIARLCLGGTVGDGRQYMSWIHVDDLNALVLSALEDEGMSGTYLTTAPQAMTNRDFMATLRRVLHRPLGLPTPAPLVRLGSLFLRTDPELVLLGRRLMPTRLLAEGFAFKHPELRGALEDLLT